MLLKSPLPLRDDACKAVDLRDSQVRLFYRTAYAVEKDAWQAQAQSRYGWDISTCCCISGNRNKSFLRSFSPALGGVERCCHRLVLQTPRIYEQL